MLESSQIRPLTKRRLTGEPYTRDPKIEERLSELSGLARDELIERTLVLKKMDPNGVVAWIRQ